jgi:threonine dehydratase
MTILLQDIKQAAQRIKPYVKRTPVLTSSTLNHLTEAELYFKCENFQKAGAFKFRGACHAVFSLTDEEAKKGVATHSSGNHGAALALAARTRGIKAYIVMPNNSTNVKKQAVSGYGAQITFCEPTLSAREETLQKICRETGATFIHPYDNERVISGQGTVALELLEECHDLDSVIVPIGGGGLISGIAIASTTISPAIKVIGAEPTHANDAYLSFKKKAIVPIVNQQTICDGLLTSLGKITFPIILDKVNDIYTASEQSILEATKYIWERMKVVVEPSAAVTFAIMLEHPEFFKGKKVGLVLSGGNVDIKAIANLF